MSDNSQQNSVTRGGVGKATTSGLYLMICSNITPPIVSFFCARWPILNETTWFEITVFLLASLGGFLVWATPQHVVECITRAIVFCRQALTQWRDALNGKDNPKEP